MEFAIILKEGGNDMKLKVVIHEAEEGGYWSEVPSLPGCSTQGETMEEIKRNTIEAIRGCLSVNDKKIKSLTKGKDRVLVLAV